MEENNKSMEVSKLIKEVMSLVRGRFIKESDKQGMTLPQSMLTGIISKFGKMKISELSDKLGLSNSTASGIVDRLEKQGIVIRERSSEDKRVVYVSMSEKFENMHKDFHKKMEKSFEDILNRGTPDDIEIIIDGLNTLKKLLSIECKKE